MKTGLPAVVSADSITLILGTMPGERSLAQREYYAHPGNQFRRLVCAAFEAPLHNDYRAFLELLHANRIALWNVLHSCTRTGSSDHSIRNAVPNDLEGLLAAHPHISKICFESKKAEQLYDRFFSRDPSMAYHTLPSASGLFATMRFEEKLAEYRRVLCNV